MGFALRYKYNQLDTRPRRAHDGAMSNAAHTGDRTMTLSTQDWDTIEAELALEYFGS